MPYVHFTDDQKRRAGEVDLEQFLLRRGEKLIPSGHEKRLSSDHSVTVRGNRWYDHAEGTGGGPISFLQKFYGLTYPESITQLLNGEQGTPYEPVRRQVQREKRDFALPPASSTMRRVYAYMLQHRGISREVLDAFVHARLIYESAEPSADGSKEYHNVVFVGRDEHGVPRHAHKRSINSLGKIFRINVEGGDPRYGFHYTGTSDRLYVFEAPIDLMSFLTRYPQDWQEHSFVSLCGTSEHAMLWMLEQNPGIHSVCLCLDHDEAGIEASGRLAEILHEHGYDNAGILQPEHKDWNEDLKARRGLPAQEAEEHPQLVVAQDICGRIGVCMEDRIIPEHLSRELAGALQGYEINIQANRPKPAMACIERASALALFAYGRELGRLDEPRSREELAEELRCSILPHQNRSNLRKRTAELVKQVQNVLAKAAEPGIRSEAEKRELAKSWLDLAVSCAKVPVKFEADILKQRQKVDVLLPSNKEWNEDLTTPSVSEAQGMTMTM